MIIGSSLSAFSMPAASSTATAGLSLSRAAGKTETPFSGTGSSQAPSLDSGKPPLRGSLLNLSV